MSNNFCFKSVIVISLFRLVITGNCFGISKTSECSPRHQLTKTSCFIRTDMQFRLQWHFSAPVCSKCNWWQYNACSAFEERFHRCEKERHFDSACWYIWFWAQTIKRKSKFRATLRSKLKNFPPKGTSIYQVETPLLNNVIVKKLCCYVRL